MPLFMFCSAPLHFLLKSGTQDFHLYLINSFSFCSRIQISLPLRIFFSFPFFGFRYRPSHPYPPMVEPISTAEAARKVMSEENRGLLVRFVEAFETAAFCSLFNKCRLHVK